jgi:uncharacterized protein YbjQ (UPF0145 family)
LCAGRERRRKGATTRIEKAQDQIARGKIKQATTTLWDETEEARIEGDLGRLEAVKAVLSTLPDQAASDLQGHVTRTIDRLEAGPPEPVSPWRTGMPVTTALEIPGFEVTEYIGEVFGLVVRSRGALPALGAQVKSIVGGELKAMTELLQRTRSEAIDRMVQEAEARGADAVIGMRFDSETMADQWSEICAYGTAVKLWSYPMGADADGAR